MKKILLASITFILSLALVACADKKTETKPTDTKPTETNTITNQKEKSYKRVGNDVYFGTYPQELVSDDEKIEELDSNTSDWTSYKYYAEKEVVDYMFYKDIDTNNDGKYDYRGVKFSQFRPYLISQPGLESYSYVDDNAYEKDKTYWFKYSPIKWNIVEENSDSIMVVSELLIDAQEIYNETTSSKFDHNDGNGYANNYDLSNIRKWLNDTFYNQAFTSVEKEDIKKTSVYTDATPSKYTSGPVEDNILLLNKIEASIYYKKDEERRAKGTDYAKVQGLHVDQSITANNGFSEWWVRTPSYNSDYSTITIGTDGTVNGNGIIVNNTAMGIRVVCYLSI